MPVSIDGHGVYPFLLDTGSESTLVDPTLASDIGLAATSRLTLMTSTGLVGVHVSRASLVFGAVQARDVQVLFERGATPPDGMPRPENVSEFRTRDTILSPHFAEILRNATKVVWTCA